MSSSSFPHAQQAQIIRANQRDLYHVSSLREQTESVLRSWLGTRWLSRWDKEVELAVKLAYFGFTTGRATQTLGEEYTDIWQYSASRQAVPPLFQTRACLILLPTLSAYIFGRWRNVSLVGTRYPLLGMLLKQLPITLEVVSEINLAIFYLSGTYYDIVKRLLGIRHLSSIPENPHTRPPSYSLLGILLAVRLIHRLITAFQSYRTVNNTLNSRQEKGKQGMETISEGAFLDDRPVSLFVDNEQSEDERVKSAEEDERTMLDVASIPDNLRQSRNCTLCLEERTDSCSTECGHLFCWSCIVGWGREKAECPLCRQALNLTRLLPIYNL
ncbi:Pex12 amino terminal region-domain-containing protein [Collybia nuda]|uniref:RING-type E3 ubiquitin transferase n=1 Tax=Collybia nuda TaxID=64659 RepID=A0A9P6C7S7_9AGAR|nr:Pex12 amino terminal region-domain-containing protein [Collybia nuda]